MKIQPFQAAFRVRGPKASLSIRIYYNYIEVQKSLGYALGDPSMWDSKRNRLSRAGRHHQPFLDHWSTKIQEFSCSLQEQQVIPTKEVLAEALDRLIKGGKETQGHGKQITLLTFISNWLNDDSKQYYIKDNQRRPYSRAAINNKQQLLRSLEAFYMKERPFDYETIDQKFYDDYLDSLKDKSLNQQGKMIKELKMFLKEAEAEGFPVNPAYKGRKFVVFQKPADDENAIAIPFDDLNKILNLQLPYALRIHRDWFVIGCYTGFRIGDLFSLSRKQIVTINNKMCIEVKTGKTGIDVIQQLPTLVYMIMEQHYCGGFPPKVSEQKFNLRIKEIASLANLPYAKKVVSHTMRRTFCTNAYLQSPEAVADIMRLSGHTTLKNFLRYVRISEARHKMAVKPIKVFD